MASDAQQIAIAILPKFTGFLSVCGSGFIIYDILSCHFNISPGWWRKGRDDDHTLTDSAGSLGSLSRSRGRSSRRFGQRKTLKTSAYYRLMLAMSTSDFMVSIAWFCTTWPIPKDENSLDNPSDIVYGNIGTMQTCTAQGFFIQLGIITPFYNALLAFYYYLTIRREWKEEEFKRKVEYIGHFLTISFGFGTAIAGLVMHLFNNSKVWCWIAPYPLACGDGPDQVSCERGKNSKVLRWVFYYGPLWFCIFLVIFFMTLVYVYVRSLDKRMDKYTRSYRINARDASTNSLPGDSERPNDSERSQRPGNRRSLMSRTFSTVNSEVFNDNRRHKRNERSKAVANQGLFYAGTFVLVWVFGTITRAMQLANAPAPWAILFLFAVFTPSQGFFNFLVYVRPRLIKYFSDRKKSRKLERNGRRSGGGIFGSDLIRVSGMDSTHDVVVNERQNQPSTHTRTSTSAELEISEPPLDDKKNKAKHSIVRFAIDDDILLDLSNVEEYAESAEVGVNDNDIPETMSEETDDQHTPSPIATDEVVEKEETSATKEDEDKLVKSQNANIDLTAPTTDSESENGQSTEVGMDEGGKDEIPQP